MKYTMITDDQMNKAFKYLNHELKGQEKVDFMIELSRNKELSKVVDRYRDFRIGLEAELRQRSLSQTDFTADKKIITSFDTNFKNPVYKYVAIAASVSILIVLGFFILNDNSQSNDLTLAKETKFLESIEISNKFKIVDPNQNNLGFAPSNQSDSIQVLIGSYENFDNHYYFSGDTLALLLSKNISTGQLEITYDQSKQQYHLIINDDKYDLLKDMDRLIELEIISK